MNMTMLLRFKKNNVFCNGITPERFGISFLFIIILFSLIGCDTKLQKTKQKSSFKEESVNSVTSKKTEKDLMYDSLDYKERNKLENRPFLSFCYRVVKGKISPDGKWALISTWADDVLFFDLEQNVEIDHFHSTEKLTKGISPEDLEGAPEIYLSNDLFIFASAPGVVSVYSTHSGAKLQDIKHNMNIVTVIEMYNNELFLGETYGKYQIWKKEKENFTKKTYESFKSSIVNAIYYKKYWIVSLLFGGTWEVSSDSVTKIDFNKKNTRIKSICSYRNELFFASYLTGLLKSKNWLKNKHVETIDIDSKSSIKNFDNYYIEEKKVAFNKSHEKLTDSINSSPIDRPEARGLVFKDLNILQNRYLIVSRSDGIFSEIDLRKKLNVSILHKIPNECVKDTGMSTMISCASKKDICLISNSDSTVYSWSRKDNQLKLFYKK